MHILNIIQSGLYQITTKSGYQVVSLDYPPLSNYPHAKNLRNLNSFIAFIYFASLLFCCLTPLFYRDNIKAKYKVGIICAITALIISFVGSIIWRYLVTTYLDI